MTVRTIAGAFALPVKLTGTGYCYLAPLALGTWHFAIKKILSATAATSMGLFYGGRSLMAFLIVGILLLRTTHRSNLRFGFSLFLGFLGSLVPFALEWGWCPTGSAFVCGVISTWLFLLLIRMCRRFNSRDSLVSVLVLTVPIYLIRIPLDFVPIQILLALSTAMPLLCVAAYQRVFMLLDEKEKQSTWEDEVPLAQSLLRPYWLFGFELAAYGAIAGMVRIPYEASQYGFPMNVIISVLTVCIPLIVLYLLLGKGGAAALLQASWAIMVAMVSLLLLFSLFKTGNSFAHVIVASVMRYLVLTLIMPLGCYLEKSSNMKPGVPFCILWGLFSLATAVGMGLASVTGTPGLSTDLAFHLSYLVIIVFTFVHAKLTAPKALLAEAQTSQESAEDQNTTILETIHTLGASHGLTAREQEVLGFICLGYSRKEIAATCILTENTVKGYAKNAYTKMGIHSREELLALVEAQRSGTF